jgi:hypothetical protein
MSEIEEIGVKRTALSSIKDKVIKEKIKRRKKYRLIDFYGCFKGKIFYDEEIFNFAK